MSRQISQFEGTLSNLTVMVHIHGGGFRCGEGTLASFAPDFLLDHDVIVVSGNYRVGALGLLSSEEENCPGNFGN